MGKETDGETLERTWRLLVLCSRVRMSAADEQEARDLLAGEVSPAALVDLCLRHKVLQLAGYHLVRLDVDGSLPFQHRFLMKTFFEATRQRNAVLLGEAERVLSAFHERGVVAVPLKGVVLASEVYGEIGLRAMNDLDFLIPASERRPASQVLRDIGYVVGDFELASNRIELASAETELSWRMHVGNLHPHVRRFDDPFAPCVRVDLSYDVDTRKNYLVSQALLDASRDGSLGAAPARELDPVDFAIHIAVHMYKEATNEFWLRAAGGAATHLIKVCDLREYLLARADDVAADRLCERSRELGVEAAVAHGLASVHDVYGDEFALELRDRLGETELGVAR